jgi:hypothetical protein
MDTVLPSAAGIGLLHVLAPVLAGAPGQALAVHELVVCPIPVWFFHTTAVPTAMLTDSGLKQNSVPPPAHAPGMIVTVAPVVVGAVTLVSIGFGAGVRAATSRPAVPTPTTAAIATIRILWEFPAVRIMSGTL